MKFKSYDWIGISLLWITTLLPLLWWMPLARFDTLGIAMTSLGQMAGLAGFVLMSWNFVLASRWKWIDSLFFGLNRAYIVHHVTGELAFILLLVHPLLLLYSYFKVSIAAAVAFLLPSLANIPVLLGILALATLILLMVLTLYVTMEYDKWKITHQWIGSVLILGSVHALLAGTTIAASQGLRLYMWGVILFASVAYLYRRVVRLLKLNHYTYIVTRVTVLGEIREIEMKPQGRKMMYDAGQFAFFTFWRKGVASESHPFSLTSNPHGETITITVKSEGDYTETLSLVDSGTLVEIEGAYGRFHYASYGRSKQMWIGAGIGITPILGMARSLPTDSPYEAIILYCVREAQEAVFDAELSAICQKNPRLAYGMYSSKAHNRLGIATIKKIVPRYVDYDFFVCGPPPMMASLRSQLVGAGVPNSHIHTEEFALTE